MDNDKKKIKWYNKLKKKIIAWICALDEILDKASRPLIYFLELVGVLVVIILMAKLLQAINLMYNGQLEKGEAIVRTLGIALNAMKELLVGIFVALPTAIGTLKALTKKWRGSQNNSEINNINN